MSLSSNVATALPTEGLAAAGPDGNIVEVRGISKIYDGGIQALKSVDLGFPEGQMTTLLGPSGCGKTTLLKIIAGLLEPTEGEVLVKGRPVHGPGPERAFVFQDFALMPWATVLRNVGFGLELQGISRNEREDTARRYIKKVGLAGFEGRYPHELSGGMRQRVGLARALSVDADVLLMDEPFSAVDEQTRRLFQEELLYLLAKENKSVIFVTHSIEEAVYVSDRIVLLSPRPGRVNKIVDADLVREGKTADEIRREKRFLDTVEEIWQTLKQYLAEERMER
jgi:NitT/TauT family transport system ATP-binding protein